MVFGARERPFSLFGGLGFGIALSASVPGRYGVRPASSRATVKRG